MERKLIEQTHNPMRSDVKNGKMFNPNGAGSSVWIGEGVTKTKQSRTLFITMVLDILMLIIDLLIICVQIPHSVGLEEVEDLFKPEPGFIAFRTVRRMAFIDFDEIQQGKLMGYSIWCVIVGVGSTVRDAKVPGTQVSRAQSQRSRD